MLVLRFPINFLLHPPFLMDFSLFHTIASRALYGDVRQLYAPAGSAQGFYKYGPCWLLLMAPLGWLPSHAAAVLWSTLTVGWVLITCWVADRLCRLANMHPSPWLTIIVLVLIVRSLTSEFLLGQTNFLWGLLTATFILFEHMQRPWRAALCLALAISLKLPALLFLVYLGVNRCWASISRTVLLLLTCNALSAWLLLPQNPLYLFATWFHVLSATAPDRAFEIGSQSFLALMGRLLRHDGFGFNILSLSDPVVSWITILLEAGLFIVVCTPSPRRSLFPERRPLMDRALLMVLMALFSPTCWMETYNVLFVPLFIATALIGEHCRAGTLTMSLILSSTITILLSAMTSAKLWHAFRIMHIHGETYVYLVLMIFPLFALSVVWLLWFQRHLVARDV